MGRGPHGFYLTLTKGWGQGMPPFPSLEAGDRYAVAHFVRETWQRGQSIYVAEDAPQVKAQIPQPGAAAADGPRIAPELVEQHAKLHPLMAVAARDGQARIIEARSWLNRAAGKAETAERRLLGRAAKVPDQRAAWLIRLHEAARSGDAAGVAAVLISPDSGDPSLAPRTRRQHRCRCIRAGRRRRPEGLIMLRPLLSLLLLLPLLTSAETAVPAASEVDRYAALFNQDLYALKGPKGAVVTPMAGVYDAPASDIARDVKQATWFSFLVFLPFLVLPQVLLVWIIWKYRKKADGRAPATFVGNHRLEIIWTAIPCLALVIVGIPMWDLLHKMDSPPADQRRDMVIEVRGKSFAWDYKYQRLGGDLPTRREDQFEVGQDIAGTQEPVVLVKDRRVIMSLTSNDVNHAWWIPAFGVKSDVITGRYTRLWFTPDTLGLLQGPVRRAVRPGPRHHADQRPGGQRSRFRGVARCAAPPRRHRAGMDRPGGQGDR